MFTLHSNLLIFFSVQFTCQKTPVERSTVLQIQIRSALDNQHFYSKKTNFTKPDQHEHSEHSEFSPQKIKDKLFSCCSLYFIAWGNEWGGDKCSHQGGAGSYL